MSQNTQTTTPSENFRSESLAEARMQIVDALRASKGWMTDYAEAYVDDFVTMSTHPAGGAGEAELKYAQRLAWSMWHNNYTADSPNWEVCDDLAGVLSQIDNMLTGMGRTDYATHPAPKQEGGRAGDKIMPVAYSLSDTNGKLIREWRSPNLIQYVFKDEALARAEICPRLGIQDVVYLYTSTDREVIEAQQDEIHDLTVELDRARRERDARTTQPPVPKQEGGVSFVPGVMHCAKCHFRLVRTNLYVRNGTTGAGDNKTEPCLNGCGPLWPVTWEQEARECWQRLEQMAEQLATPTPGAAVVVGDAEVLAELRSHVSQFDSQKDFAQNGVHASEQYVSDVLRGMKAIPEKWVAPLGFVKTWIYVGEREAIEAALASPPSAALPSYSEAVKCEFCGEFTPVHSHMVVYGNEISELISAVEQYLATPRQPSYARISNALKSLKDSHA